MPNLTDIERIINPASDNTVRPPSAATPAELVHCLATKLRMPSNGAARNAAAAASDPSDPRLTILQPLAEALFKLPKDLMAAHPQRTTTVAENGDLVRLPVHARDFKLAYAEGMLKDEAHLRNVLKENGVSPDKLWQPQAQEPFADYIGNVAFYGIEFVDGDIGPYKEFFLLIKLNTQTAPSSLFDMFVWRLCVNSPKAAAWGSPWHYPKKVREDAAIQVDFDKSDDLATNLHVRAGKDISGSTWFPEVIYRRANHKPAGPPMRWSHESFGGGFSFVNPAGPGYPKGYLAPIENQGEMWIEKVSQDVHTVKITVPSDAPSKDYEQFKPLEGVTWKGLYSGRSFQAIAKDGGPVP